MKRLILSQTLRQSLADWTDEDVASYYVAVALGVAPDPGNKWDFWGGRKDLFWTANPLGEGCSEVLEMLVRSGVLEKKEDHNGKFRWNTKFDWDQYGLDNKNT